MSIVWKQPAVPRHVIQMLIIDKFDKVLVMHRSNNVRSARNVWSIPTGEHDIGETVQQTVDRELMEEYGLTRIPRFKPELMFQYENIAGDKDAIEQYHWIISVYAVRVLDVTKAINREPEKHDVMKFPTLTEMIDSSWKDEHVFHESLDKVLVPELWRFRNKQ